MSNMSKLLPPEFFINPRCPPCAALRVHTNDPDVDIREAGKSLSAAEVGLGTQSDSQFIITGEDEELNPPGGT